MKQKLVLSGEETRLEPFMQVVKSAVGADYSLYNNMEGYPSMWYTEFGADSISFGDVLDKVRSIGPLRENLGSIYGSELAEVVVFKGLEYTESWSGKPKIDHSVPAVPRRRFWAGKPKPTLVPTKPLKPLHLPRKPVFKPYSLELTARQLESASRKAIRWVNGQYGVTSGGLVRRVGTYAMMIGRIEYEKDKFRLARITIDKRRLARFDAAIYLWMVRCEHARDNHLRYAKRRETLLGKRLLQLESRLKSWGKAQLYPFVSKKSKKKKSAKKYSDAHPYRRLRLGFPKRVRVVYDNLDVNRWYVSHSPGSDDITVASVWRSQSNRPLVFSPPPDANWVSKEAKEGKSPIDQCHTFCDGISHHLENDVSLHERLDADILSRAGNQEMNILATVAEGRQTMDLVLAAYKKIVNFTIKFFDVRNLNAWGSRLAGLDLTYYLPSGPELGHRWSELWLSWVYGVKPLLADLNSLLLLLTSDSKSNKVFKSRIKSEPYTIPDQFKGMISCERVVHYNVINESNLKLARYGLTDVSQVVWELVPYSFLFDWIIPIGNLLSTMDVMNNYSYSSGTTSYLLSGEFKLQSKKLTDREGVDMTLYPEVGLVPGFNPIDEVALEETKGLGSLKLRNLRFNPPDIGSVIYVKDPTSISHFLSGMSLIDQLFVRPNSVNPVLRAIR